ncbi:MAG: flagellar assembly protein FliW [Arthrobacter sp.]
MSRLSFTTPPPGLGAETEYDLTGVDGAAGLFNLQAQSNPELGLFLIDSAFVPGYEPEIPEAQLLELGLGSGGNGQLLLVAQTGERVTVNLMAPIVVNPDRGLAAQVILEGRGYPLKADLAA